MVENEQEIREYIEQIRGLCDKVIEKLDNKDDNADPDKTTVFPKLVQNAKESLALKDMGSIEDSGKIPYLVRQKTGEKIMVNRNIFKIGKEPSYVDYCIKDNPTISRNHADIIRKPDGFYIKDCGSLNHTFLCGTKVDRDTAKKLEHGCLLQLADEIFVWHSY